MPAQYLVGRQGLPNFFAKLSSAAEEVCIAYFGGSITAAPGWRPKTTQWFRDTYPQTKFTEIDAAIGGTGSDLGVYRFHQDVLRHKPDLIFVEFSVNDGSATPENIWRGMEGIIRQAWKSDPDIDICYVYTFRTGYEEQLDQGLNSPAASADEILADYYGIPSLNPALRIAEMARAGELLFVPAKDEAGTPQPIAEGVTLFSDDGVHPTDEGQEIYTTVITAALQQMATVAAEAKPHVLPAPFIEDNWEKAKIVSIEPWMLTGDWKQLETDDQMAKRFSKELREVWEARQPGAKLSFKFKGTAIKLYDIMGPDAGQVVVTVDGESSPPNPRFDSYCTYYRLAPLHIAGELPNEVHEINVELHPDQPDRTPASSHDKEYTPEKYDGTVIRIGGIMLLGELQP
ncbi:MAG TPA: SGNH/GDSL hydrolase family protein [Abditibacteriaceae bacterium]